jgi:hypothetical protein
MDGTARGDDRGDQTFGIGEDGAVVAKRFEVEVDQRFSGDLFEAQFKQVESRGIGVENFADGAAGNDTDVEVFDEGAESLLAFAKGVDGFALFGDIADDDESAAAAVEFE